MQRQKSMLSFFQKAPTVPKTEKSVGGGALKGDLRRRYSGEIYPHPTSLLFSHLHSKSIMKSLELRLRLRRNNVHFFPSKSFGGGENDEANRSGHVSFSSIKHKFVKPNSVEKPCDRNLSDNICDNVFSISNNSNRREKEGLNFSQDSPAKNKKNEVPSEMPMNNSKRVKFSHDLSS